MAATKKRAAPTTSVDDEMRQFLVDIRILEGTARVLQSRLDVITAALSETLTAIQTLEGVRGRENGSDTLLPVGSGSFVKAKLSDPGSIIIGVGAGVCIEKTVDDSIKDLRLRSSDLEKARSSVTNQLGQVVTQVEDYRDHLGELVRKKGGGAVEIV